MEDFDFSAMPLEKVPYYVGEAVKAGDVELVDALVDQLWYIGYRSFPVDTFTDKNGDLVLTLAFDRGDVKMAEMLLSHSRLRQKSALEIAAERGHDGFVQAVLTTGPPKYRTPNSIDTALVRAASAGHARVVELLLTASANPSNDEVAAATRREDATIVAAGANPAAALTPAVMGGHVSIVRKLLDYGAQVDRTALVQAACRGHTEIVAMLLASYGTVSEDECSGCTVTVAHSLRCGRHKKNFRVDEVVDAQGHTALHLAVKNGLSDVVEMLLDAGANINQVGADQRSCLHIAAAIGDLDLVQWLISSGANIHLCAGPAGQALAFACARGHCDVVRLFIWHGAVVDNTSLLNAISNGHADVVEVLLSVMPSHRGGALSRGGSATVINSRDRDGVTPLIAAAKCGDTPMVKMLLRAGADIQIAAHPGWTALAFAAKGGHTRVVETLLDHAVKNNSVTAAAGCALFAAAKGGRSQIVIMLLVAGVDVNRVGGSALLAACKRGDATTVSMLLAAGVSDRDPRLLLVPAERGYEEIVATLLAAGVHPHVPTVTRGRRSVLYQAVKHGHVGIVKKLLAAGAPFLRESGEQIRVFQQACKNGNIEMIELLIDAGAISCRSDTEASPTSRSSHQVYAQAFHSAARDGNLELLDLLLRSGANENTRHDHQTPLRAASGSGSLESVRFLLGHGCEPDDMDDALHTAIYNGQSDVVRELLLHGGDLTFTTNKHALPVLRSAAYSRHGQPVLQLLCSSEIIDRHVLDVNDNATSWCPRALQSVARAKCRQSTAALLARCVDIDLGTDSTTIEWVREVMSTESPSS